jgi:site-specific recombinase XerD
MFEDYFGSIAVPNLRSGPLGPHAAALAAERLQTGYSRATIRIALRLLDHLSGWLQRTRRRVVDLDRNAVEAFLKTYRRRYLLQSGHRATLDQFIEHLQRQGVIVAPLAAASVERPISRLEQRYDRHLRKERGLTDATAEIYKREMRRFLLQRFCEKPLVLSKLSVADVSNFIVKGASSVGPKRAQLMVTALRSFFRFLIREGEIQVDLAVSVPTVPCRRQATVPRYISDQEVEQLLRSCNRSTPTGRRDYAILLLLARLGLRAGEVAALRLEDIDWRSGEICVLGKGQVRNRLPLLPEIGKALVAYLQGGRPRCPSRYVFLCMKGPHRGFGHASAVCQVVRFAISRAGLKPPFKGAHLLRHSFATSLLRKGASMAEIAELLRHRSPTTTEIYAKVDSESLRALARPWPTTGGGR